MKKLGYTSLMLMTIFGFDLAFSQMIVKSSDGSSVLMRVDDNGNATITAKMTAQNIAMTGQTPLQGKVLYSNDNAGNLRWSAQPTSSGQYLSWNASTNQ